MENQDGAEVCSRCRAPLATNIVSSPTSSNKFCEECGTAIASGVKFCGNCGSKVQSENGVQNSDQNVANTLDASVKRSTLPRNMLYGVGAIVLFVIVGQFFGNFPLPSKWEKVSDQLRKEQVGTHNATDPSQNTTSPITQTQLPFIGSWEFTQNDIPGHICVTYNQDGSGSVVTAFSSPETSDNSYDLGITCNFRWKFEGNTLEEITDKTSLQVRSKKEFHDNLNISELVDELTAPEKSTVKILKNGTLEMTDVSTRKVSTLTPVDKLLLKAIRMKLRSLDIVSQR